MMMFRTPACLVLLLIAAASGQASENQRLRHNPFTRPDSVVAPAVESPAREADRAEDLELRATMVTSSSGLANVAGQVLRPGDEIDGYRLLKVFENRAIFVHNGTRKTVFVKHNAADENE